MSIPKVIHYCWFGGKPLPKSVRKCITSWKKYCPDYEIVVHNEENYDINKYLYTKQAHEAKKWAFVSDVARLEIIYEYGGIYLDTDVELIRPLDDVLNDNGFMGFEDNEKINTGLGFAAEKHSPIIRKLLDDYVGRSFYMPDGTLDLTPCPVINMKTLVKMGLRPDGTEQVLEGFHFYPEVYFSPKDYCTGEMTNLTDKTISIHHYDASWETKAFRIKKAYRRLMYSKVIQLVNKPVKLILKSYRNKNSWNSNR